MAGQRRVGGRYLLQRQVAAGGMGTVWQARDETLRRDVAVKMLHLQPGISDAERTQAVERAMREARIAARLHHPNAVQVYDVVDDDGGPCLIMQYVPSRSLATAVAEDGPMAPHEVARLGTQIAAALAAAHRVGIVHRDVKPGNVLMADDGTVKITDFGVSHAFDDVTVTSTGMVTGTPAYLAPEVARGEDSTAASDVYSLGSTLYFAVQGRAPFGEDGNPMAVLHRVASGRPEPAARAGELGPMLESMMAPAPADRPAMVDIATRLPDLHPLAGEASDTDVTRQLRVAGPSDAPTARVPTPPRPMTAALPVAPMPPMPPVPPVLPPDDRRDDDHRRTLLVLGAVALVAVLGVVLAVVLLRSGSDTNTASGDGTPTGAVSSPAATGSASSAPTSPTAAATSAASSTPTSSAPTTSAPTSSSPTASPSTTAAGTPTAAELENAIVQYFQLIPGDLDAGWERLTPSFQEGRAGGRESYDEYWDTVRRVDVENPRGDAPGSVTARLVYRYKNGNVVRQTTTFRLVRQDGVLKIDGQS